ncbi:hypothetical protein CEXT_8661 [Caerostris extrusa]|uniref:Uncharacterized protein n=1 Tax=Caerostris extrusa TaxID=172846 RepID=A0AAV4UW73_CAEEX|nr:hypothetical protein CEXT_8661 [Caerostris extrusa]
MEGDPHQTIILRSGTQQWAIIRARIEFSHPSFQRKKKGGKYCDCRFIVYDHDKYCSSDPSLTQYGVPHGLMPTVGSCAQGLFSTRCTRRSPSTDKENKDRFDQSDWTFDKTMYRLMICDANERLQDFFFNVYSSSNVFSIFEMGFSCGKNVADNGL